MKNKNVLQVPALLGDIKHSWSEKDFRFAIKKFRQNAPSAPIPRLYDAYIWLKQQLDTEDEDSGRQFSNFIEHFLRILEDRGAGETGIYSEVLRDSAEYKYLSGLFSTNNSAQKTLLIETPVNYPEPAPEIKIISLKEILSKKNTSLLDFDINKWHQLIDEHFRYYKTEESFVKECLIAVNSIKKRSEKETYHIEIIIVYAFDTLLKFKKLSLKTKDFSMQLLNLMTDRGDMWNTLHKEYKEIIKK